MADADSMTTADATAFGNSRTWRRLRAWHRRSITDGVDRPAILDRVREDSGWSSRYAFMVTMSAGIAILGLLLSSPAVIIGAMLISPLMGPIIGLGFALATFDWAEARKSLMALALGTLLAVGFTALVVQLSPLNDITPEILARTRPNLFDLFVAIFSALAGAYATVRGRGETIVGVAIATALMPPLAVVGFGLATGNMPIFLGAVALYVTNFIAIALSATAVARFYGFGSGLSPQQSRRQAIALVLVLVALAIPLGFSLRQIAWEAWATRTARSAVEAEFGEGSRLAGFDPNFAGDAVRIRATVFTDRYRDKASADLERELGVTLGRPVRLRLSQILVNDGSQRAELDRARSAVQEARSDRLAQADLATRLTYTLGVASEAITIDTAARRALIDVDGERALEELFALEQRARAENPDWDIQVVPSLQALPPLLFPASDGEGDEEALRAQMQLPLWALARWDAEAVTITGARTTAEPSQRATDRAERVAALLAACGYSVAKISAESPDPRQEREQGQAAQRRVSIAITALPAADTTAPVVADGAPCLWGSQQPAISPASVPATAEVPATSAG